MTGRGSKKRARPSGDTVDKTPEKSTENKASKSKDDKKASQDNSKVTPAPRFGNRFSKMTKLGSGTFGEVWKGFDDEFGRWVAIKKFQEVKSDHLGINMMVIREISLLRQLDHPNIARTIDVLIGKKINCDSLLLVMELEDMDLYSFQRLPDCPLTLGRIRFITRQILDACCYLHSNHVMHRDLKPDNILICCSTGVIKVADFGYARTFSHVITPTACLFKYSFPVQAPSYKAPEILLGCDRYSCAIDVWSIGCILGELLCAGRKIFTVEETNAKDSNGGKESSASASRIKTETLIGSLNAVFKLLGCLSDINAPALRTLPNYNIFNKSHLIGLHPFREDFKRRTDASIRSDLMAMMDPRFRCCEATHLLQQLLFLDPILRTSCRVALETSIFLRRPGSLPPGGLVDEWAVSC